MNYRFIYTLFIASLLATPLSQAAPDYVRDIRPIFADNCYACHGPDANKRESDLRFDDIADAIDYGAITPGDLEDSLLVEHVTSEKSRDRMPPPDSKKSLTDAQIAMLLEWIDAGAQFEGHWAFQKPSRPTVPPSTDWTRDPIDAFVLDGIMEAGFQPAPEVDPILWLRRVTFDLTGLPPTPEAIEAFEQDTSASRYEKVVDALLASTHYGEHMASAWLDVARFADTFGYQSDVETHLWPWRDWVIASFNQNMPYDQFLTEQLAGDLLPNPTQDQKIATAFNRLHRQTNEGGSVNEEYRIEYNVDRVATMGTAFMGLTLECARCHDHKFDPISQKSFYEFMAFFDKIDESGLYSHFTNATPTPTLNLYTPASEKKHRELLEAITAADDVVAIADSDLGRSYKKWIKKNKRDIRELEPEVHLSFDGEKGLENSGSAGKIEGQFIKSERDSGAANKFSGESAINIKEAGIYNRYDAFSFTMSLYIKEMLPHMVILHKSKAASDAGSRGYEIMIDEGKLVFSLVHFWPGNAVRVQSETTLPVGEWVHIAATYDGSSTAAGINLFVNGESATFDILRDKLTRTIWYNKKGDDPALTLGARFRDNGFRNGRMDDFMAFPRKLTAIEVQSIATRQSPAEVIAAAIEEDPGSLEVQRYYAARIHEASIEERDSLRETRKRESDHLDGIRQLMVMTEEPGLHPTHILDRGQYQNPTTAVQATFPGNLFESPDEFPMNRLGLAQWLLHPDHPLTSRVAVNRLWQQIFGQGLVATQEDFGLQGELPSHPELLDYLANEYRDNAWDTKALLKRLVLSAAYRQSSAASKKLLEHDPDNVLLARASLYRRSAEEIRDAALVSSGLITKTIGGPSVKPYQPDGLWKDVASASYVADKGDKLYRRSIYTFIKRTVPPPSMLTFDATTREVCVVRRERTTTPLQALILLNDPQYVEAARVLAEKTLLQHKDDHTAGISTIFRALLTREATAEESSILNDAFYEQRDWFANNEEEAKSYLAVGDKERLIGLDNINTAAMTAIAQGIMNLNEFQVKL
ncbi:MAG: DUF1553 domain-containing protein [Candidatus Hydrogenedentota bacterium]